MANAWVRNGHITITDRLPPADAGGGGSLAEQLKSAVTLRLRVSRQDGRRPLGITGDHMASP